METDEENSGSTGLKRQRAPLSDSEDNVFLSSEVKDSQKRRRLEAAGQENRSPKPSSSRRLAELETKPDTPIVPSVRSRVLQLTQRRDGVAPLAQRCLSDPGADSPSNFDKKGSREHLLSEGEFHQRLERFKVPDFQASPAPALRPIDPSPRACSNSVSDIQQKLQCTTTPSSQQASRIREERRQELSRLQPISENAWLKRSSSDPTLTQQADGDAEIKDGSFTEILASGAEKQSLNGTGKNIPCDSDAPAASVLPKNCNDAQLQMEMKEESSCHDEEVREQEKCKTSFSNEVSQHLKSQTVLKLSFSEDQSFSGTHLSGDLNASELPTGNEQSLLDLSHPEESNMGETGEVDKKSDQDRSEMLSCENMTGYSYSEEEIEPSTDEELRLWRYPRGKVCNEEESVRVEEKEDDIKEGEADLGSSRAENEKGANEHSDMWDGECHLAYASAVMVSPSEMQENETPREERDKSESESCLDYPPPNRDHSNDHPSEGCYEDALLGDGDTITEKQEHLDIERCACSDDTGEQANESPTLNVEAVQNLQSDSKGPVKDAEEEKMVESQRSAQGDNTELGINTEDVGGREASSLTDGSDEAQCLGKVQGLGQLFVEEASNEEQERVEEPTEKTVKPQGGESSKKVTFILEPELIVDSKLSQSNTSSAETHLSDAELSSHDETNTAEIIDQMFGEVLEYAGKIEQERVGDGEDGEDHDSGIAACSGEKDKTDMESGKEKSEEEGEAKEDEGNEDELLTFPSSCILSPLSKSVEAVVTPLRLAVSQKSNPPTLLLTPEETSTPPAESAPLYSIDAYRTQRLIKNPTSQSVTPVQRRAAEQSQPQPSVNTKARIAALNEEAGKLQTVISQTLQALSCCTDEEHGRGSLEEAEAEKLLLVSCEKRSALLAEVTRLREERSSESGEAAGKEGDFNSLQPCRGTVSISNIQLPLKVEFVCSSHSKPGRPSHYFFVLIRYGPCNIVATPLATAADAQNGDTISFPTAVTLKDIRSSFEIDVEVYSLSHTSSNNCSMDRTATKSRVTPRKLLNTLTRSSNSLTSAAHLAPNTRRSSNFSLVGSHKITLASLGHSKFLLDKMKLEGKIRRLLGDEFQEKVPFLSPLEGNIYLRLDSQSHSNVQHQGFLTMFELISGYGVWHRRYFVLEGCTMYYWNHPNDKETKAAEGSISLSSSPHQCVRPVKRDSCARPFTFELVNNIQQQPDSSQDAKAKCWFSADTKQERLDWVEKLSQALLDLHTWNQTSTPAQSQQSDPSSSGNLRESIL